MKCPMHLNDIHKIEMCLRAPPGGGGGGGGACIKEGQDIRVPSPAALDKSSPGLIEPQYQQRQNAHMRMFRD